MVCFGSIAEKINSHREKLLFLFVGGVNTLFGYSFSLLFYYFAVDKIDVFFTLIVNTIVTITFSFITYKVFVFKSHGDWLSEYLRSYVVYGISGVVGIVITWFFVKIIGIEFIIIQTISLFITIIVSFNGHKRFTFRKGINNG